CVPATASTVSCVICPTFSCTVIRFSSASTRAATAGATRCARGIDATEACPHAPVAPITSAAAPTPTLQRTLIAVELLFRSPARILCEQLVRVELRLGNREQVAPPGRPVHVRLARQVSREELRLGLERHVDDTQAREIVPAVALKGQFAATL